MYLHKAARLAVALLLAAGCSTVRDAREAQEALAPRGFEAGASSAASKIDLRGASLENLVDFALTNRPSVVSAGLAVDDARLALVQLAADAPVLSAHSSWTALGLSSRLGYSASSRSAHFDDLEPRTHGDASGALSLELPLWDAGRNDARIHAQAENVLAAELGFVTAGYEVFQEVSDAYFGVLEADALLEVARTNELEFAEHLRQAEDREAAGEAKKLDVLKARLDLSQARERTVSASNDVVTAGADLMRALGVDLTRGSREDVLPPGAESLAEVRRAFADTDFDAVSAFDAARTNAPAMRLSRARFRAASADVDYAVADLLPEVMASVSLNWTDPLWLWSWGVSGVQSVFQGFRKTTAVDRAVVALQRAATDVDSAEQALSRDLAVAVATRDNAREAWRSAQVSVSQARENLDLVAEQYRLGDASRVDFTDAVAAYAAALGNRVTAFYRGQRAEAALFRLVGADPAYAEEQVSEEGR